MEHLRGKISDKELYSLRAVLNLNADVFSKHKADIGCCNFVEHKIEIEEGSVPHREGARRMTQHKSEACRKEIEMLMEYDMIERGQLRFCCDFCYLKTVTIMDAYPIPRIDESLSKLGSYPSSSRRWIWALRSGKCHSESKILRKRASRASWDSSSGRGCRSDCPTQRSPSSD